MGTKRNNFSKKFGRHVFEKRWNKIITSGKKKVRCEEC